MVDDHGHPDVEFLPYECVQDLHGRSAELLAALHGVHVRVPPSASVTVSLTSSGAIAGHLDRPEGDRALSNQSPTTSHNEDYGRMVTSRT